MLPTHTYTAKYTNITGTFLCYKVAAKGEGGREQPKTSQANEALLLA